jgi:hypothetical protein
VLVAKCAGNFFFGSVSFDVNENASGGSCILKGNTFARGIINPWKTEAGKSQAQGSGG